MPAALAKGVVAEIPDNHEIHWTGFMTPVACDVRQLYASSLGTLACKHALERKKVKGGTDCDSSLHESQGAAVAELDAPINPDLSVIHYFAYISLSWASCRRLLCPVMPHSVAAQPLAHSQP